MENDIQNKKCEFLRITKKLNPILMQYYIQNDAIKEVKYAKYLGVIIDHHLSWNEHINYITSRLILLNVFFSVTSVNAPLISKHAQLLLELSISYPGIRLHCMGSSYTKE